MKKALLVLGLMSCMLLTVVAGTDFILEGSSPKATESNAATLAPGGEETPTNQEGETQQPGGAETNPAQGGAETNPAQGGLAQGGVNTEGGWGPIHRP